MFENKHIVVGISGGIAAFKAAGLVSQLRQKGADVHCIMTANAAKLVTPITFGELSGNDVTVDMFANISKWDVEHIALAKLADLFVVAPATADIIGKVANGIADDMLSTTIMATKAKVLFVPSMNTNMYENPIVQANMEKYIEAKAAALGGIIQAEVTVGSGETAMNLSNRKAVISPATPPAKAVSLHLKPSWTARKNASMAANS